MKSTDWIEEGKEIRCFRKIGNYKDFIEWLKKDGLFEDLKDFKVEVLVGEETYPIRLIYMSQNYSFILSTEAPSIMYNEKTFGDLVRVVKNAYIRYKREAYMLKEDDILTFKLEMIGPDDKLVTINNVTLEKGKMIFEK